MVTMRESTVEAKFFRYDEFEAGMIVTGKIQDIDPAGWVHISLAPHLFGVITPQHQECFSSRNQNWNTAGFSERAK